MKKIINTALPVVITTTRTPLNGSLKISSNGGAMSQVYDAIEGTYSPEDRTVTPLVLSPVVSLVDPDTQKPVSLSNLASREIKWYVGNSMNPITSTSPDAEYYLQTNDGTTTGTKTGSLVVRHNVNATDKYAVPVRCEFSFVDSSRGELYKYNDAVLLTSENKTQDILTISLENPKVVSFNPIFDESSQKVFKAVARLGSKDLASNKTKFFWYVNGVLASSDMPCYVSGQNTNTLTIDAEYADNVLVTARVALDTTSSTPDNPAKAESTLLWQWPTLKALPYSMSGEAIRLASQQMTFGSIVQAYGKDISNAKRNRYCKLRWFTRATDVSEKTYVSPDAWGFEKTIGGSALFRTGGRFVHVGVELYRVGAKSTVGGNGQEVKIENEAADVVISTQRTPLTGSLTISSGGSSLSQVYDVIWGTYEPEDRKVFPLVLTPIISITDPDTGQAVPLTDLSQVELRWYVGASAVYITSRNPGDDYYLQTVNDTPTGALVVRHNVNESDKYAVPVRCELSCTDSSRNEIYKFSSAVLLSSEIKAHDILSVSLQNPKVVTYNPIFEDNSQKTFKAVVQIGSEIVSSDRIKFFWYANDVLIGDDMLGYVSGQHTDTLVLDAEFLDNTLIKVRISTNTSGSNPNNPAKAESTLLWQWPKIDAIPYSMSGEAIKTSNDKKRFGTIIQAYGHDIPESKADRYFRVNWYTQPTDTMVKSDKGWGRETVINGSDLFKQGGDNINVGIDLYTVGILKAVVGYDSYQMVNNELVGVGEPKMVVDDATGAVVVCGD